MTPPHHIATPPRRARGPRRQGASRFAYVRLKGSHRIRCADSKRIGPVNADDKLELTLTLRGPKLSEPSFFQPRSDREFMSLFSASKADLDIVEAAVRNSGMKILYTSQKTRSVRIAGSVRAISRMFPSKIGLYRGSTGDEFRGREGIIKISSELSHIVTGVFGLDERRMAWRQPNTSNGTYQRPGAFEPADIERVYNFPRGSGRGQKIAIAEFGGGVFESDLKHYCRKFKRKVPKVRLISVGLQPLNLSQILSMTAKERSSQLNYSTEVMVDLEIIAGLCPRSKIDVYFAPSSEKGWIDLLDRVLNDPYKPTSLSVSWGSTEDSKDWSEAGRSEINARLQMASLLGINVCAASGDNGTGNAADDDRAHVLFPSSSPYVLSVGGSMIADRGDRPPEEEVWWVSPGRQEVGGGASGGGVSVIFPRPSWQNVKIKSINPGKFDGRILPDVSALAGPPSYSLIFRRRRVYLGGTSAAAPVWAALIARINSRLPTRRRNRFLSPALYLRTMKGESLGKLVCRDITTGQNGSWPAPGMGYNAKFGYDAACGWGVPNGELLLAAMLRTASSLGVSPAPLNGMGVR